MRITPELFIIRKLSDIIKKHESSGNIPIEGIIELKIDLEDLIKQEV